MENKDTETTAQLASPRPVSPREAAIVNARNVTFEWRSVEEATAYRLEVASDASFRNVVFDEQLPADTTALTVADFFPVDEQTYFWRVLAKNEDTWSRGERIESFVSATPDEAARHQKNRPDEDEAYGPATMLVRSASKMVSDQLSSQGGDRLEKEREMGVAYEGIPTGQILAVAVSILFAVGIIVIILFQWTNITEAAIRQASSGQSMRADLRETELQANQKLTGYEVVDEDAGVYRIPIDQAMDLMVNEAYQQGNRTYSSEAPFVSGAPADTAQ
jgi:hypothetical protein